MFVMGETILINWYCNTYSTSINTFFVQTIVATFYGNLFFCDLLILCEKCQ